MDVNLRLPDILLFSCIDAIYDEIISYEVYLELFFLTDRIKSEGWDLPYTRCHGR